MSADEIARSTDPSGRRSPADRVDRRAFVHAAAGAALGLGAASGVRASAAARRAAAAATAEVRAMIEPSAPGGAPRSIRKALKYGMIGPGATVREKFLVARDCGYDGVELDSPNAFDVDEVLAARDETGIAIPGVVDSVHWRDTLGDPDPEVRARGRAGVETAIRDCHAYHGGPGVEDGGSVLLVPAVVNAGISYADAWSRSMAEIRRVLPLARELGVRISIENVWNGFLLSPLEAARYVDELDPTVMGWHFDVGNIVNFGWPAHWIEALGSRITRLDAKEFSRRKRDDEGLWRGFAVELLEGDCDWPATMAALDRIGYRGWMAAEVSGGDEARLRFVAERMDRIIAS